MGHAVADLEEPGRCEACGRQLPPQHGRGRRRRYCDATCRSAARRGRARGGAGGPTSENPQGVNMSLTEDARHGNLDAMTSADPVASAVRLTAGRLVDQLARPGAGSPLAAVAAARELSAATNAARQAAVDRARAAGHSWRRIGDVLGTSRQAAFQRFGRPVDPRTGEPMTRAVPPGLAERAVAIFVAQAEGRWEDVLGDLNEAMRDKLDADQMAAGWGHTVAVVGSRGRVGAPVGV